MSTSLRCPVAMAVWVLLSAFAGLAADPALALTSPPRVPAVHAVASIDSFPPATASRTAPQAIRPRLTWWGEGLTLGSAYAASRGSGTIRVDRREVPAAGLDPRGIHWGVDRRSIQPLSGSPLRWSDRTLSAARWLPAVLAVARGPLHPDLRGLAGRAVLYTEATLWSDALTAALKRAAARPRPFLYREQGTGPVRPGEGSFESMPSGHASRAWCAVSFAVVDHLYSRPGAGTWEDAGVGFAAGAIGGLTAALRVRGGVHFPSDVLAGAGIGFACGAGVPLWHGYTRDGRRVRGPGGRRWLAATAGMVAGALVGALAGAEVAW